MEQAPPRACSTPRHGPPQSGFARMPVPVVSAIERDMSSGSWGARHAELRTLDELDVGLRLIVASYT